MARKRYCDEDVLKLLREIDVHLHDGLDVVSAGRKVGISDKSYYYLRKKFGSLFCWQVSWTKLIVEITTQFIQVTKTEYLE